MRTANRRRRAAGVVMVAIVAGGSAVARAQQTDVTAGVATGVRVTASRTGFGQASPAAEPTVVERARGKAVRVTFPDGSRREGRLVTLSATDVTIDEKAGRAVVPLLGVSRIERIARRTRMGALLGAAAGFVVGYLGSCGGGDEGDCWPEVGALGAGIGVAAGALIGRAMDATGSPGNLLYASVPSAARVSLLPFVTRRGAGARVAVSW